MHQIMPPDIASSVPQEFTATDAQRFFIEGLRELADFLDRHPHLSPCGEYTLNVYAFDRDELLALVRGTGGTWEKKVDEHYFMLRRRFGPIAFDVFMARDAVCERRQVGTRTVEVPDPDAPKVTVEEPVFEWDCGSLLGEATP